MNRHVNAFARAKAMMALIVSAMQLPMVQQQAALAAIGPYHSRGKGRAKPFQRQAWSRKFCQSMRGRYMPHQGGKECARRRRRCFLAEIGG